MEQYLEAWGCPRLIKIACLGDELKSIIKDLEKNLSDIGLRTVALQRFPGKVKK